MNWDDGRRESVFIFAALERGRWAGIVLVVGGWERRAQCTEKVVKEAQPLAQFDHVSKICQRKTASATRLQPLPHTLLYFTIV